MGPEDLLASGEDKRRLDFHRSADARHNAEFERNRQRLMRKKQPNPERDDLEMDIAALGKQVNEYATLFQNAWLYGVAVGGNSYQLTEPDYRNKMAADLKRLPEAAAVYAKLLTTLTARHARLASLI